MAEGLNVSVAVTSVGVKGSVKTIGVEVSGESEVAVTMFGVLVGNEVHAGKGCGAIIGEQAAIKTLNVAIRIFFIIK